MRKLKKINGFLIVRFNDREKRNNPTLGSFGVIDAEQYTGDLDYDLDAMEYTDADLIEIAVEQARGLNAEKDFDDEPTTYTVIAEKTEKATEETVEPKALALSWQQRLETQIKSKHYPDIDPRTAVHELSGYKAALAELGLLDADDAVVELNTFGDACEFFDDEGHRVDMMLPSQEGLALVTAHDYEEGETFTNCTVQTLKCRRCGRESFAWSKGPAPEQEETLAYICDEVCKYREGRTQEELDAICAKCKVDRWAGAPPTLTPREVRELRQFQGLLKEVGDYVNGEATPPPRDHFKHLSWQSDGVLDYKVYRLGVMLEEHFLDNDCIIYRNISRMARELDETLDGAQGYAAKVLQRELGKHVRELRRMYHENHAVKTFREEAGV